MKITENLEKANEHLNIAIAEFSKIAGGAWIGSWDDYRKLVKLKLRLESTMEKVKRGECKKKRTQTKYPLQ